MIKLYLFGWPYWRRSKQVWQIGIENEKEKILKKISKRLFDRLALDFQRSNYLIMKSTLKAPFNGFLKEPKHFYFKNIADPQELEIFLKYHKYYEDNCNKRTCFIR